MGAAVPHLEAMHAQCAAAVINHIRDSHSTPPWVLTQVQLSVQPILADRICEVEQEAAVVQALDGIAPAGLEPRCGKGRRELGAPRAGCAALLEAKEVADQQVG